MTHPIFRKNMYIETPFEIRFQAMLRYAWDKRSWHVIVADPGSGKTVGIREMIKTAGVRDVVAFHQNQSPKNSIHDVAHAVQELLDGRVEMQSRTLKRTKVLGMRREKSDWGALCRTIVSGTVDFPTRFDREHQRASVVFRSLGSKTVSGSLDRESHTSLLVTKNTGGFS